MIEIDQMDKSQLEASLVLCFMSLSFMLFKESTKSNEIWFPHGCCSEPPLVESTPVKCYSGSLITGYKVPRIYADRMMERLKKNIVEIARVMRECKTNPNYWGWESLSDGSNEVNLASFKIFIEKEYGINFKELVEVILKNECIENEKQD